MLDSILASWTVAQTARAAHPSMTPDDQQRILDWMLHHKDVTITKFGKVKRSFESLFALFPAVALSQKSSVFSHSEYALTLRVSTVQALGMLLSHDRHTDVLKALLQTVAEPTALMQHTKQNRTVQSDILETARSELAQLQRKSWQYQAS